MDSTKQGHKCCGFCCDTRRAVIIVDIVNLVLLLIGMIIVVVAHNNVNPDDYNDDNTKTQVEKFQDMPLGGFLAYAIVFMLLCVAGIVGANKYNVYLVGIAAVAYCVSFIFSIIQLNYLGMIVAILFVYPHFVFIAEVRKGIMSDENYHNEEMSCCCV
jgi:hypothetical protein